MLVFTCFIIAVAIFFYILKYYIENGGYIIINKRFAIRRYIYPSSEKLCERLAKEMANICRGTLNGDLLPYPFFQGDFKSLNQRLVCMIYDRKNLEIGPVAFSAPFSFIFRDQRVIHAGLMMVKSNYQGKGIQSFTPIHFILYTIINTLFETVIITEIGASSSYITIQERFYHEFFPNHKKPYQKPNSNHLAITKYMLDNHRLEFGCSNEAILNEKTLVVVGSNQERGGGAYQLIATHKSRKSSSEEKEKFIQERLDIVNGDEQFFVGYFSYFNYFRQLFMSTFKK